MATEPWGISPTWGICPAPLRLESSCIIGFRKEDSQMAHAKKGNTDRKNLNNGKKMGSVKPLRDVATGVSTGQRHY